MGRAGHLRDLLARKMFDHTQHLLRERYDDQVRRGRRRSRHNTLLAGAQAVPGCAEDVAGRLPGCLLLLGAHRQPQHRHRLPGRDSADL